MRARLPYRTARQLNLRRVTRLNHPAHVHHERLEEHHMAVARLAHEIVTSPGGKTGSDVDDLATSAMRSTLDQIAELLTAANRELELLLESLSAEMRRENVYAIAMLSRAHDDCCHELAEAGDAICTGTAVHVRIRLARLFAAVGRAEQAHYYLRTALTPAA
jgi:hypothetical protein